MAGSWNGTVYNGDGTNETVTGGGANESIFGREGNDVLSGAGGNDLIDGGVGNDSLDGGLGNDRLIDVGSIPSGFTGVIGRDTLRGGEDDDRLEFYSPDTGDFAYGDAGTDTIFLDFRNAAATDRVTFRLAPNTVAKLNDANTVALSSIERVDFFGGKGDDFVVGGALDDTLRGGFNAFGSDGNDVLRGMGGNDVIDGGTGIQQIDGGDGIDTASFDLFGAGVAFRIVSGAVINLGAWGRVSNVENLDEVFTSNGDDIFDIDQTVSVTIYSGDGADRITVADGGGYIYSGQGNDLIQTGAGSDFVDPGYGADTVYLGAGNDVVEQGWSASSRGSTEADRIYGEGGNDRVYSSAGADLLDGGADSDTLYGGGGDDTILGGDGLDVIEGEGGADRIDGGAGNDIIRADYDYWTATTPADADLISGGEGNDIISGGIGQDTLNGGLGDDTLTLGPALANNAFDGQVDQLNGGGGIDTLGFGGLFAGSTAALTIALGAATSVVLDGQTIAEATSVERLDVTAYGTGDHRITGGRFADSIRLGEGDDTVSTLGGDDTILAYDYGGTDGNTILSGTGNDAASIYLGGNDQVDLEAGDDALTLSNVSNPFSGLSSYEGGAGTDTLIVYTRFGVAGVSFDGATVRSGSTVVGTATGFERVNYYGSSDLFDFQGLVGDDRVELGGADDTAFGNGGNDTLLGGAGADTLGGGSGADSLDGGAGNDTFVYGAVAESSVGSRDLLTGFVAGADRIDLGAIDARSDLAGDQALVWRGSLAFTGGRGQLRFEQLGGDTLVQVDLDGNRAADLEIVLDGLVALARTDFDL